MKRSALPLAVLVFAIHVFAIHAHTAHAQGTRLWSQSRYEEFQKGTAEGVALRSDGRMMPAPATALVFTTPASYVWSLASDAQGSAYVGTGSVSGTPATLLKVAPDGKSIRLASFKELAVQAVCIAPDGAIYAATSPDGKLYRLPANATADAQPETVFDPAQTAEKPKYLWALASDGKGSLYLGTGAPAAIYRIRTNQPNAKPELFFHSDDQHIRSLAIAADGTVYAGSDGNGVLYRITPDGKAFALYAAAKREITSLAVDAQGNVYAAAIGSKAGPNLPPLPVQGNIAVTASITFIQAGAQASNGNTLAPDGSDIFRIAADGTPQKLLTLKDDIVYALALHNNELFAATGNHGHIYSIDTHERGQFADLAHLDANQAVAFAARPGGLYVATSNTGKLFRLDDKPAAEPTYTSDVFDAQVFSQWGRVETGYYSADGSAPPFDLYARSGNVANPRQAWSEWHKVTPNSGQAGIPAARYAQWKAVFHGSNASLNSVGINYLPGNVAPVVDEVIVQPGARIAIAAPALNNNVMVSFPAPTQNPLLNFQQDPNAQPLAALKDKTAITARWLAHDDNGDDLTFSLYYRGAGEANWLPLKDKITDRFYSFDSALLPDGNYELKVVASDAPSHTAAEALAGEHTSASFEVDTTPPVPSALKAELITAKTCGGSPCFSGLLIHATLDATDATSPIAHAEYSIDAGPWQYLEPAGRLSDSLSEHYDFSAPVPALQPDAKLANPNEHIIAIRIYDRYDNMAAVKTIVK